MSEKLKTAIEKHRKFYSDKYDTALIADAYIAQLDEQAALKQPYDWEWLESRPEFERFNSWCLKSKLNDIHKAVYVGKEGGGYWWSYGESHLLLTIPAPATRADVIKLLEVFR